jgi:hypothetical protein
MTTRKKRLEMLEAATSPPSTDGAEGYQIPGMAERLARLALWPDVIKKKIDEWIRTEWRKQPEISKESSQ